MEEEIEKKQKNGASDRNRTGDNHVGNVMLYQLSYTRTCKTGNSGCFFKSWSE